MEQRERGKQERGECGCKDEQRGESEKSKWVEHGDWKRERTMELLICSCKVLAHEWWNTAGKSSIVDGGHMTDMVVKPAHACSSQLTYLHCSLAELFKTQFVFLSLQRKYQLLSRSNIKNCDSIWWIYIKLIYLSCFYQLTGVSFGLHVSSLNSSPVR